MLRDKRTLLLVALVVIVGLGIGLASVLGPEATAQGATYVLDEDLADVSTGHGVSDGLRHNRR